jgi:hypothetical protein
MSFWRRWFTTGRRSETTAYGTDKENPVLLAAGRQANANTSIDCGVLRARRFATKDWGRIRRRTQPSFRGQG